MSRLLLLLICCATVALPRLGHTAAPGDFRFLAEISGTLVPGVPVRLRLSAEMIAATHNTFADLRLFDQHGQETPYVIYPQQAPQPPPSTFTWRILSYSQSDTADTIVLERPEDTAAFQEIEVVTTAQDFHKSVEVQTSTDLATWNTQVVDSIFDFSSRLTLRKTTIALGKTAARYVRLLLHDITPVRRGEGSMTLRYDGLELSLNMARPGGFRIDRILGRSGVAAVLSVYDHVALASPAVQTDPSGNTVLALGRVNLPLAEVTLSIETLYYHRAVELWTADVDRPEAYHRVASGVVYNIPGMQAPRTTLVTAPAQARQARYVQLKILNGDNPPLRIGQVSIAWPQYHLYFIPEASRRYTLYAGNEPSRAPVYELRHVLPFDPVALGQYAVVSVGPLQPNPTYRPSGAETPWYRTEKTLLTGLILLLAGGLGVWIYRLMQQLPAR